MNNIKNLFETLSNNDKDIILELVSHFHCRNGTINYDNSMGEIEITPLELANCLAYMMLQHKN